MDLNQKKAQLAELKSYIAGPISSEAKAKYESEILKLEAEIKAETPTTFDPTQITIPGTPVPKPTAFPKAVGTPTPPVNPTPPPTELNELPVEMPTPKPLNQPPIQKNTEELPDNAPPVLPPDTSHKPPQTDIPEVPAPLYTPKGKSNPGKEQGVINSPDKSSQIKSGEGVKIGGAKVPAAQPVTDKTPVDSVDVPVETGSNTPMDASSDQGIQYEGAVDGETPQEVDPNADPLTDGVVSDSEVVDGGAGDSSGWDPTNKFPPLPNDVNATQTTTVDSKESPVDEQLTSATLDAATENQRKIMDQEDARVMHEELSSLAMMTETQKMIVSERENEGKKLLQEYTANLGEVENRELINNIAKALGTAVAGMVGLATDLPISQYFTPMDMYDPTTAKARFDDLYRVSIARADESETKKLAQLKGAWDAVNDGTSSKEQVELFKTLASALGSSVNNVRTTNNKPDESSVATNESSAEATRQYADNMKALEGRYKSLMEDPNYVGARKTFDQINQAYSSDDPSANLYPDDPKMAESKDARANLIKNYAPVVNSLTDFDSFMKVVDSDWDSNWWGKTTKEKAQNTPAFLVDPKSKELGVTPESKAALEVLFTKVSSGLVSKAKATKAKVPTAEQLTRYAVEVLKNDPSAANLSVEGLVKLTLADTVNIMSGAPDGGIVGRLGKEPAKLSAMDLGESYLGIPVSANGFLTNSKLNNMKKQQITTIKSYEDELGTIKREMISTQRTYQQKASPDRFVSKFQLLNPKQSWEDPKYTSFNTDKGKKTWMGLPMNELEKAYKDPESDEWQLPVVWEDADVKSKVVDISTKYGMKPNEFLALLSVETGDTFDPRVTNSIGATGLIQFVPSTASGLLNKVEGGWKNRTNWSDKEAQQEMAKMDLLTQLQFTDMYLSGTLANKAGGLQNAYSSIFTGNTSGQPLVKDSAATGNQYANNFRLDTNNDGKISQDEWMVKILDRAKRTYAGYGGPQS